MCSNEDNIRDKYKYNTYQLVRNFLSRVGGIKNTPFERA
jgi:hypothetical protein